MKVLTRKLIPWNTKLDADKIPSLKEAISDRETKLRKLKYGDVAESLFLMDELFHLRKLLEFNITT